MHGLRSVSALLTSTCEMMLLGILANWNLQELSTPPNGERVQTVPKPCVMPAGCDGPRRRRRRTTALPTIPPPRHQVPAIIASISSMQALPWVCLEFLGGNSAWVIVTQHTRRFSVFLQRIAGLMSERRIMKNAGVEETYLPI